MCCDAADAVDDDASEADAEAFAAAEFAAAADEEDEVEGLRGDPRSFEKPPLLLGPWRGRNTRRRDFKNERSFVSASSVSSESERSRGGDSSASLGGGRESESETTRLSSRARGEPTSGRTAVD